MLSVGGTPVKVKYNALQIQAPFARLIASLTLRVASRCVSSKTCVYRSAVMPVDVWPSISLTTFIGTSARSAIVAKVWRSPWNVTGMPSW